MPRYAAERVLPAPLEEVWAVVADPERLPDWWPGISGVEPDRRGLAPGARWQLRAGIPRSFGLALFRRPGAVGTLLVTAVERGRKLAFDLTAERLEAELELEPSEPNRTRVTLAVRVPWAGVPRSFPRTALARLHDLVRAGAE